MDVLSRTSAAVRAAGGVLWRGTPSRLRVAIVHRPRYDDWSLPKGKLKRDEPALVGACREVFEETGVRPTAAVRLPTVRYSTKVRSGYARKTVHYWTMTVHTDAEFVAGAETDALDWVSVPTALNRVSYPRDVAVLSAFAALPPLRLPLILVRSTADAAQLVPRLRCFGPMQLLAGGQARHIRTLQPLGAALKLPVKELSFLDDPRLAADGLAAGLATPAIVCAPTASLLALVADRTGRVPSARARGWVISVPVREGDPTIVDTLT